MAPLEETASQLSSTSSTGPEEIKIEIRVDGHWEQRDGGKLKYVGGQKYWEKVPSKLDYASLMHRMSSKVNGAVTLKYAPPGEEVVDPENLITCVDNDHVQEMLEEYWKAKKEHQTPGRTFRLQMWLYQADEEDVTLEDIEGYDHQLSSGESNHSSASAGTRAHHMQGRKLNYTPSTASRQPHDMEMQQREAQEMVTWMAEQEEINEANWQAHLARNLHRAHECTYDSFGWPHDRSPFIRAMREARPEPLPGGNFAAEQVQGGRGGMHESPGSGLSPGMLARGMGQGEGFDVLPDVTPMEAGTPVPKHDPLYFTQDPYKEELVSRVPPHSGRPTEHVGYGGNGDLESRAQYFLPSLLGSEVGNVPQSTLEAAEKSHIENVVAGMVHYALQDEPTDMNHLKETLPANGGSAHMAAGGLEYGAEHALFRTPSHLAITYDNVYRIPQNEIHVVHSIGEGTFGEVVLATNEVFGKIAVKWLKPAKMDKHKTKFWEEARMLAALNHPNVLRFYGVVTAGPFDQTVVGIMTEFMNGSSLSNYLRSGAGRISLFQRAELAREAINGLAYLHAMNIVHFDLKPDNLLLDKPLRLGYETPGVKVADFGLSKQKFSKYVSGVRDLRGTLPYMAPELVSDPDHVSESADVWSLGIVFWEMLTMETPFQHLTPQGIITGLMMGSLRPDIPEDCEPEWQWLLEGCLRTNPAQRLTLREITLQLDRIVQDAPPAPPAPASPY